MISHVQSIEMNLCYTSLSNIIHNLCFFILLGRLPIRLLRMDLTKSWLEVLFIVFSAFSAFSAVKFQNLMPHCPGFRG